MEPSPTACPRGKVVTSQPEGVWYEGCRRAAIRSGYGFAVEEQLRVKLTWTPTVKRPDLIISDRRVQNLEQLSDGREIWRDCPGVQIVICPPVQSLPKSWSDRVIYRGMAHGAGQPNGLEGAVRVKEAFHPGLGIAFLLSLTA